MRYTEILNEALEYALLLETPQRAEFLLKNFGPKLGAKFLSQLSHLPYQIAHGILGMGSDEIHDLVAKLADPENAQTANSTGLQEKVIEFIMNADPTQNKAYARWIVTRYLKSDEKLEDIGPHLSQTLEVFAQAARARRVDGNIDAYKSFHELTTACEPFLTGERETSSNKDRKNKRDTKVDTRKEKQWENDPMLAQAKVIYDTDDYMILVPNDAEAAAYFGKNTHWCTTTTMYQHYAKDGPLYIILRRKDAKRWQFHFESDQFMDELDRGIDLNEFIDENRPVFDALGEDKFVKFIGSRAGYSSGDVLSIRHFSPEVIERANDVDLARSVSTMKDLAALPKTKVLSEHFFKAILEKMNGTFGSGEYRARTAGGAISEAEANKMLPRYFKAFAKKGEHFFDDLLPDHPWLLKKLPENLQTDFAKETLANHLYGYQEIGQHVPQPWNESVDARYWLRRCEQDRYLRPALSDAPQKLGHEMSDDEAYQSLVDGNTENDKLPRRYQTDENLARLLAHFPQDIEHFHSRLTPDFCQRLLDLTISNATLCGKMLDNLPERCLTKKLQLPIYKYAQQFTTKATQDKRDGYLACLTRFHNDHWPWKASKISDRMALVNPKFQKNPEQFHSRNQATAWVDYHPEKLSTLPDKLIDEDMVVAALLSDNRSPANKNDTSRFIDEVLDPCDPEVVKPEWAAKAITELSKKSGGLAKCWKGIPKKYLTQEMIDSLLKEGNIALNDDAFPEDAYTGANVLARFNRAVDATYMHTVTKDEAEAEAKKKGQDRARQWNHKEERIDKDSLKHAWNMIPDGQKKQALIGLFSMKAPAKSYSQSGYRGYGSSQQQLSPKDWHCMAAIVDKQYLDTEALDAFVGSLGKYDGRTSKEYFKFFPKSAYTPENMAKAVDVGLVDKVPDDLADDNVIVSMLIQDAKALDLSKVTPKIMIAALHKDGWHACHKLCYLDAKQEKAITPALADLRVSLAMLRKEGRKDNYGMGGVNHDQVQKLYSDKFPERRKNWDQECYDLAAGDICSLKTIPEEFRSDKVLARAVETTEEGILSIPDREGWLNKNGDKLENLRRITLLAEGLAQTEAGWRDYTKRPEERTTVKGVKGSYVMTKLKPQGETLMIFDPEGNCINAISANVSEAKAHHYSSQGSMWSKGSTHGGALAALAPYRLLIADAFEKNTKLYNALQSPQDFEKIQLYGKGTYGSKTMLPVEKWPRKAIAGTDLTYVAPKGEEGGRWSDGGSYYMFDGEKGMLGRIGFETSGRGVALQYAHLHTTSKMARLLDLSNGFAVFLDQRAVISGQNSTFKESSLFTELGVRGPGRNIWYSLLEHRVHDHGDLSVWTSSAGGSPRVSVAHSKLGILTEAKRLKNGDFTITYLNDHSRKLQKEISEAYEGAKSKI